MAYEDFKDILKRTWDGVATSEIMPNQEVAKELHKSTIKKFEKQKV